MVTRFLLGTTEAGFGPGGLWYISTWYTKKETAKRVMIFYFGILSGQAFSKLIAFGILAFFGLGGEVLLRLLGVGIPAFRISGGLLLFWIAFEMVFERRNERKQHTADIAITGSESEVAERIAALADIGVTDFAAVEFPGNPDEAAATRAAVKLAMS